MATFTNSAFDAYVVKVNRQLLDLQSVTDRTTALSDTNYTYLAARFDELLAQMLFLSGGAAAPVATIAVGGGAATVASGADTSAFTAVTKDSAGATITGHTLVWTSSDATKATINASTGVAHGVAAGLVVITCTSEGKTGAAALTITA